VCVVVVLVVEKVGGGGAFGFQAGGLTDISRWLSEARRAIPPERMTKKIRTLKGCQMCAASDFGSGAGSGIPPGCGVCFMAIVRWCRSPSLAQPPA